MNSVQTLVIALLITIVVASGLYIKASNKGDKKSSLSGYISHDYRCDGSDPPCSQFNDNMDACWNVFGCAVTHPDGDSPRSICIPAACPNAGHIYD